MKTAHLICLGSLALFSYAPIGHAEASLIKSIDMQRIMQETPEAKQAQESLRKQFELRHRKILDAQKALEKDADKMKKDLAIMPEEDKKKLERSILTQERDLQRLEQDFQQDFTQAQRHATETLFNKVHLVIETLAKKHHYDLVIPKNVLPYSDPKVDITQSVIDALAIKGES